MEVEELLTKSKWIILKELAKGDKSAAEIARKTGQSIANASQQLALLEAYNIVKKAKQEKQSKPGKPKIPYALNQEVVVLSFLKPGFAEKKLVRLKEADTFHKFFWNAYFILAQEDHYPLTKYVCEGDLLKKADSLAFLQSNDKEIELLIITEHNLAEIREKYSNVTVACIDGKNKKIISWSHNKKEIEEGLEKKDEYFVNLVKNSKELIDKKEHLMELKEKL